MKKSPICFDVFLVMAKQIGDFSSFCSLLTMYQLYIILHKIDRYSSISLEKKVHLLWPDTSRLLLRISNGLLVKKVKRKKRKWRKNAYHIFYSLFLFSQATARFAYCRALGTLGVRGSTPSQIWLEQKENLSIKCHSKVTYH